MSESLVLFKDYKGEKIDESFVYDKKNQPLVDFLNINAEELSREKISTIKTINLDGKFIGYYAVSMSSIEPGDLFDEKRAATYPHPAIIIGRILIDKRYRDQKIGSKVIVSIILLAKQLNKFCACRFIIVDSKKDVVGFYKKTGFVAIQKEKQKRNSTTTMLFDLKE